MDRRLRALLVACGMGLLGMVLALPITALGAFTLGAVGVELTPLVIMLVLLVSTQGLAFGGSALLYLWYRGLSVSDVGVRLPSISEVGITVASWAGLIGYLLAAGFAVQALGLRTASNQAAEIGMRNPEVFLLLIPASFLLIGPGEELLWRGIVQGRLREAFSAPVAIGITGVVFAAIHFLALTSAPLSAKLTTLTILVGPAFVFGATYEYTENIVVPTLIHAMYNATLFAIAYVSVTYAGELSGATATLPV